MVDVSGCHAGSDNWDVLAQDEFDSTDIELDNDGSDGGSSCGDDDSCLDDDTCIMGDGEGSGTAKNQVTLVISRHFIHPLSSTT